MPSKTKFSSVYIFKDNNMKTFRFSKFLFFALICSLCIVSFSVLSFVKIPSYKLNAIGGTVNININSADPGDKLRNFTTSPTPVKAPEKTSLKHIFFGIGASADIWNQRKNYVKLWWRRHEMRGMVWLDKPVENSTDDHLVPPRKISGDVSRFKYENPTGPRSGLRMTRIISEILRSGVKDNVRWFVLGDDDTVFVPENLVSVLSKYDHNQFYYIGSNSESHIQNLDFSYGMAYGGGGIAISYPLAVALEKIQDRCIQRYPKLYGSDDRIHACMTELGVPLTKEIGFHQFDVFGNAFGLLTAHPITPLVSIHHLDVIEPIFPNSDRLESLQRLAVPMHIDPPSLLQQTICYDHSRNWTISSSWGYVVQIFRKTILPRQIERPPRTFMNWHRTTDRTGYPFNTRSSNGKNVCENPFVYFMSNVTYLHAKKQTQSVYLKSSVPNPDCKKSKMTDPSTISKVEVYKKSDPNLWKKSPRRNCCRILSSTNNDTLVLDIRPCKKNQPLYP